MRYSSSACQVVSVGAGTILANGGDPQIVIAVNVDHRSYMNMECVKVGHPKMLILPGK